MEGSQGSVRESYAVAADRLSAYAAEADAKRIATTGEEILSVARLLAGEPRLRRALSDSARPAEERAGLLGAILAGKVSDDTLGLLAGLVEGRWAGGPALLDATEQLGVEAVLAAADRAGRLGDVEDQLFRFSQIVSGDRQLSGALGDSTADIERRLTLLRQLLEGKADPATAVLAEVALRGFGGRSFDGGLHRLIELAAARRDRQVAYVTTAAALTDDEEQRLADKLSELYGRQISLKVDVDPAVIGGVRVRIGSEVFDGTIARRLDQTRKALAG